MARLSDRKKIERIKQLKSCSNSQSEVSLGRIQKIIDNKKRWITYYRNNMEIYIETRMGFHSFGYQNFSYHLMGNSDQYIEVSTRGTGKSLRLAGAFATAKALLYPNSKILVTATNQSQSMENYLTAFLKEVKGRYSKFIGWLWDNKYITSSITDKGAVLNFWNGSIIYYAACIDSSRGLHADTIIGEELRLIKKSDWDSIAMPMAVTRRPSFRNLPEYIDKSEYDEETKVLCITSNRTKNEWFNRMYNNTFVSYFKNTMTRNRVFSADIFLAIEHGLKTKAWFIQQQNEMDELSFRMEILNETVGEVEGAFFNWEMFRKNQNLKQCLVPLSYDDIYSNKIKNRKKKNGEVRILFADLAFTDKTNGNEADNTCLGIMSIIQKGDRFYRWVEFIETRDGGDLEGTKQRIRELYFDFEVDYIVCDARNAGESLLVDLSKPFIHPERNSNDWNSHGLTLSLEFDLHTVTTEKVYNLRSKAVDQMAIPCIIPMTASKKLNTEMWFDMARMLKTGEIQFLVDDIEFDNNVLSNKEWFKYDKETKARIKAPHLTTNFMISEAVNLKQTWVSGDLKLEEPTTGTKDCIVALCYGNLIASKIVNKLEKAQQEEDFDISKWKLVY